jgi:hypothetical protein
VSRRTVPRQPPGYHAIIGSTVGSRAGRHVPSELLKTGPGAVFAVVGSIVLAVEFVV